MRQTLDVLNAMQAEGIIGRYAIAGAVAAYNYVEATATDDLDILISFQADPPGREGGLVDLMPIFSDLARRGYKEFNNDGVVIEGWPVQFLPVATNLDAEALVQARVVEIRLDERQLPVRTCVLSPEHLVATALKVGRPKDLLRIAQFLVEDALDLDILHDILQRHGLRLAWQRFCVSAGVVEYDKFRNRNS